MFEYSRRAESVMTGADYPSFGYVLSRFDRPISVRRASVVARARVVAIIASTWLARAHQALPVGVDPYSQDEQCGRFAALSRRGSNSNARDDWHRVFARDSGQVALSRPQRPDLAASSQLNPIMFSTSPTSVRPDAARDFYRMARGVARLSRMMTSAEHAASATIPQRSADESSRRRDRLSKDLCTAD